VKVIIDLIEDMRDSIKNNELYTLSAMLLKEDSEDKEKLIYAGEASIGSFHVDKLSKELLLTVEKKKNSLSVGELIKHLLIMDMDMMMYEVKISVSEAHEPQAVVGFGFNAADSKYALFIMA
jgi:hypothetical protein